MRQPQSTRSGLLADQVPDEPRWIDLRGLLLSGRCDLWVGENPALGFVALSWDFPFASLWGEPPAESLLAATEAGLEAFGGVADSEEFQLLAPPEARDSVQSVLSGWGRRGIVLHGWMGRVAPNQEVPEVRLLELGHRDTGLAFDLFPEASRRELELDWVSRRPMATAIVEGRPVSYCWAGFTTESLWDVAIETALPHRRQGWAAACFHALRRHMDGSGLVPAWGAMVDNAASLGLAARLGFQRQARLDGWYRKE